MKIYSFCHKSQIRIFSCIRDYNDVSTLTQPWEISQRNEDVNLRQLSRSGGRTWVYKHGLVIDITTVV